MRSFRIKDQYQTKLNKITPDRPWDRQDAKEFIGFGSAKDAELLTPDMIKFNKTVISQDDKLYLITSYLSWWRITNF